MEPQPPSHQDYEHAPEPRHPGEGGGGARGDLIAPLGLSGSLAAVGDDPWGAIGSPTSPPEQLAQFYQLQRLAKGKGALGPSALVVVTGSVVGLKCIGCGMPHVCRAREPRMGGSP
jgi:hypothetical protein